MPSLWEKWCFATSLATQFWIVENICNSLYLHVMNVNGQVAWVAIHQIYGATHYNSITIQSKQLIFNYYATPL
jgi:hypothetical protein